MRDMRCGGHCGQRRDRLFKSALDSKFCPCLTLPSFLLSSIPPPRVFDLRSAEQADCPEGFQRKGEQTGRGKSSFRNIEGIVSEESRPASGVPAAAGSREELHDDEKRALLSPSPEHIQVKFWNSNVSMPAISDQSPPCNSPPAIHGPASALLRSTALPSALSSGGTGLSREGEGERTTLLSPPVASGISGGAPEVRGGSSDPILPTCADGGFAAAGGSDRSDGNGSREVHVVERGPAGSTGGKGQGGKVEDRGIVEAENWGPCLAADSSGKGGEEGILVVRGASGDVGGGFVALGSSPGGRCQQDAGSPGGLCPSRKAEGPSTPGPAAHPREAKDSSARAPADPCEVEGSSAPRPTHSCPLPPPHPPPTTQPLPPAAGTQPPLPPLGPLAHFARAGRLKAAAVGEAWTMLRSGPAGRKALWARPSTRETARIFGWGCLAGSLSGIMVSPAIGGRCGG